MAFRARITGLDNFKNKIEELKNNLPQMMIDQIKEKIGKATIEKYNIKLDLVNGKSVKFSSNTLPDDEKKRIADIMGISPDSITPEKNEES